MARAETVRDNETGGNGPLPCHNTCSMEVPHPLHTWPNMLMAAARTSRSGIGLSAVHLRHNQHHLEPFQALNRLYLMSYPHPEGQQLSPTPPPAPAPPSNQRNESSQEINDSLDLSDSDKEEESRHVFSRRGPLPDLLPQNEHPSRVQIPGGVAVPELDVLRVAQQLRTVGDEFNATVLCRALAAPPHWEDWRDVFRAVLTVVTQTLSTLCRRT
uniref:BCL2 binding component 3 n=1 Tax=Nothobranchius rachovii TaxID=451742 RepID=A0A1A8SBE2_9TELE